MTATGFWGGTERMRDRQPGSLVDDHNGTASILKTGCLKVRGLWSDVEKADLSMIAEMKAQGHTAYG